MKERKKNRQKERKKKPWIEWLSFDLLFLTEISFG